MGRWELKRKFRFKIKLNYRHDVWVPNLRLNPNFSHESLAEFFSLIPIRCQGIERFPRQAATAIILDLVDNPVTSPVDGTYFAHCCFPHTPLQPICPEDLIIRPRVIHLNVAPTKAIHAFKLFVLNVE